MLHLSKNHDSDPMHTWINVIQSWLKPEAPEELHALESVLYHLTGARYRESESSGGQALDPRVTELCAVVVAMLELNPPRPVEQTGSLLSPKTAVIVEAMGAGPLYLPYVTLEASAVVTLLLQAGWNVRRLTNANPEHLVAELRVKPELLMILAHTDVSLPASESTVGFTDDRGIFHVVERKTLATVVKACAENLELVMLAGCKSSGLGMMLAEAGVRHVQCWETLVHDAAAQTFDLTFLQHWLDHGDTSQALSLGISAVEGTMCTSRKQGNTEGGHLAHVPKYACLDPEDGNLVDLDSRRVISSGLIAAGIPTVLGDSSLADRHISGIRAHIKAIRHGRLSPHGLSREPPILQAIKTQFAEQQKPVTSHLLARVVESYAAAGFQLELEPCELPVLSTRTQPKLRTLQMLLGRMHMMGNGTCGTGEEIFDGHLLDDLQGEVENLYISFYDLGRLLRERGVDTSIGRYHQSLRSIPQDSDDSWETMSSEERVAFELEEDVVASAEDPLKLSLIHISEPTRLLSISYAVFCLKKKKNITTLACQSQ
eukprot:TRINITY_DN62755_c0_g1_i1.p1 TRINITY_DN62755_c0_g1~~TRINITY_DN62755_c0_g1_i1.p1  ORF type:complete len:544 (-),score=53.64 TRINITY_DN62755_c0_g1_i1:58-1689(-)